MAKQVNIGLIGFGTVGEGVVAILNKNSALIKERTGVSLKLKSIADIDLKRKRSVAFNRSILTKDAYKLINDPEIDIIVEAIGGESPAKKFILSAISKGKHVVTSNKEVIVKNMEEILSAAKKKNVSVLFEASVGGGIPILGPIRDSLVGNKFQEIFGIVNGTTNFILSKMEESFGSAFSCCDESCDCSTDENGGFKAALKEAQARGFAEANPKLDIEGFDAAYKAAILASVAFGAKINLKDVPVEGISKISSEDISYALENGYSIKLLAVIKMAAGELEVRVYPVLIPQDHPLASVRDNYNAIYVKGDAVGNVMFHGLGAGSLPTASSVVGDIVSIAKCVGSCTCASSAAPLKKIKMKDPNETTSRFYIRLKAPDRAGVLSGISGVFADKKVSIQTVVQKETIGDVATIIIILHEEKEKKVMEAIKEIKKLSVVKEVCNVLRVGLS